jgi:hypothetical protein
MKTILNLKSFYKLLNSKNCHMRIRKEPLIDVHKKRVK